MPISAAIDCPAVAIVRFVRENEAAATPAAYASGLNAALERIFTSAYWLNKAEFSDVRQQFDSTGSLGQGWDSQGADPPNSIARTRAKRIIDLLETTSLPPARVTPTVEGGIALSFVGESRRAVVEVYNTGEIAAAIYSDQGEPMVWELEPNEAEVLDSIRQIRAHLAV